MSNHISAISKSCFCHIRDLRRIRNTLDLTVLTTAKTIATSLVLTIVTLFFSTYLILNFIVFNLFLTLLLYCL